MTMGAPTAAPTSAASETTANERAGLTWIAVGAGIALIAAILEVTVQYIPGFTSLLSSLGTSLTNTSVGLTDLVILAVLVGVGTGAAIAEMAVFRAGFVRLATVDNSAFRTPSRFSYVAITGLAWFLAGVEWLLIMLYQAVNCANGASSIPSSCLGSLTVLIAVAFTFIGVIMALVGYIVGILLGLWRIGARYQKTATKVGTILLIFPYLNIVGAILILIQVTGARQSLH